VEFMDFGGIYRYLPFGGIYRNLPHLYSKEYRYDAERKVYVCNKCKKVSYTILNELVPGITGVIVA